MTTFSGLAGEIRPQRFSDWNMEFNDKLGASLVFWGHLGFSEASAAHATVNALEMLKNTGAPALTLQDLEASPFYRKLTLTKQSGVSQAQRKKTPLSHGDDVSRGAATSTGGAQTISFHGGSAPTRELFRTDFPNNVVPWAEMPVSFDTVRGDSSRGATSESHSEKALASRHNVHTAIGQYVSGPGNGRYSAGTEGDLAQTIARYIRIIGSVVRRELIPDIVHQSVPSQAAFDPRLLLVAAYSALSRRDDAPVSQRFFSMSKFSGLAGAIPGNSFIRWTHRFAGDLEEARDFWAQLGLGDAQAITPKAMSQMATYCTPCDPACTRRGPLHRWNH